MLKEWAILALVLHNVVAVVQGQESIVLTPPYFNIAEKRKVTVNATCGEGVAQKEVYCKLVGYDRLDSGSTYDILDGQVWKKRDSKLIPLERMRELFEWLDLRLLLCPERQGNV